MPPAILMEEVPATAETMALVALSREAAGRILHGHDDRLLVVVGPCSIHDPAAGLDYARKLREKALECGEDLFVVMRVYFEKPRTTVGWKGLINDPRLDGSFAINEGLREARRFLADVAALGLPAGTEFLDPISPQFLADLVSWGAIGARTSESQVHRELASGLSMPVGFKNGTDGRAQGAIEAIRSASHPHHFLSVTKQGVAAIVATLGNRDCHLILRGGTGGPNYARRGHRRARSRPCRLRACRLASWSTAATPTAARTTSARPRSRRSSRARSRAGQNAIAGRDDGELPRRGPPGPRGEEGAGLRPEHHRRLHELGAHGAAARHPGRRRALPPPRSSPPRPSAPGGQRRSRTARRSATLLR